jgi:hypothetical protein
VVPRKIYLSVFVYNKSNVKDHQSDSVMIVDSSGDFRQDVGER